jgi:hypothetical protein
MSKSATRKIIDYDILSDLFARVGDRDILSNVDSQN